MSRITKNLYNQALFEVKAHYEKTGKILSSNQLDKLMKSKQNLDGKINYRLLPAQVAQQTLKLVKRNIKSFFEALVDYKKHPDKYKGQPQFPIFLPRNGYFVVIFPNQQSSIRRNGDIKLRRDIIISIPRKEFEKYKEYFIKIQDGKVIPLFQQIRIVPKFNGDFFNIEIVYQKEEINLDVDVNRVMSLDLGVNNLVALVDNTMVQEDRKPILINGRPIKSINQFYNKKLALMQSSLSLIGKFNSTRLRKLMDWCNEKISDYMHKASRFIINYCLDNRLGHIVIGKNDGWKQKVNIGKRNNQNFVDIPFDRLIQKIQYKAQLVGIQVTIVEESYTSKCSALDLEIISKHEDHAYSGKRVGRGLFKTACGLVINADVNGALNILRKIIGDDFLKSFIGKVAWLIPSSGYLCYPIKVCF